MSLDVVALAVALVPNDWSMDEVGGGPGGAPGGAPGGGPPAPLAEDADWADPFCRRPCRNVCKSVSKADDVLASALVPLVAVVPVAAVLLLLLLLLLPSCNCNRKLFNAESNSVVLSERLELEDDVLLDEAELAPGGGPGGGPPAARPDSADDVLLAAWRADDV